MVSGAAICALLQLFSNRNFKLFSNRNFEVAHARTGSPPSARSRLVRRELIDRRGLNSTPAAAMGSIVSNLQRNSCKPSRMTAMPDSRPPGSRCGYPHPCSCGVPSAGKRSALGRPLSRQAIVILRELQGMTGQGEFLFPAVYSVRRCMSNNTLNAALRRLGYSKEEVSVSGFRATASTPLNEIGWWNPDAIKRQLALMEENDVRRAYMHAAEFWIERVEMMQVWADYLDQLRNGSPVEGRIQAVRVRSRLKKLLEAGAETRPSTVLLIRRPAADALYAYRGQSSLHSLGRHTGSLRESYKARFASFKQRADLYATIRKFGISANL